MSTMAMSPIAPEKLLELIDRLEQVPGPARGIDEALMSLFYIRDDRHIGAHEDDGQGWKPALDRVWVDPTTDKWVSTHAFEFSRSVDAALALITKVLPGVEWSVRANVPGQEWATATVRVAPLLSVSGECATPALSLLCALLRAVARERTVS